MASDFFGSYFFSSWEGGGEFSYEQVELKIPMGDHPAGSSFNHAEMSFSASTGQVFIDVSRSLDHSKEIPEIRETYVFRFPFTPVPDGKEQPPALPALGDEDDIISISDDEELHAYRTGQPCQECYYEDREKYDVDSAPTTCPACDAVKNGECRNCRSARGHVVDGVGLCRGCWEDSDPQEAYTCSVCDKQNVCGEVVKSENNEWMCDSCLVDYKERKMCKRSASEDEEQEQKAKKQKN